MAVRYFHVADYCVLVAVLGISSFIGVYFAWKDRRSTNKKDFFGGSRQLQPTSSDGNHAERRPPHVEEEEGEKMDVGAFADKEETQEGWCRSIGGRYVPEEKVEEVLARRRERKHLNLKKNKAMAERAVDKLEVRLPMGTEKIILRPAGGIDSIKKKLGVFAGNAILEAAGLPPMAEEDIVFNKNNQTILISTPNKERAEAFAKIKNIRAGEEDIGMTAHPAMPEGGKGVIYGINLELTEEQIHKALDNPRNPTYTAVRRLGRSSESVIINFKDLEVPKTVKFFSQWIPCHLYKKKYDVCYACGKIGHRQDVCPDPRSTRCRGCGLRNPPEEHACEPKCLLCGKKHQLGDPTCRELYRKPHWVKQRDAARAEARAEQGRGDRGQKQADIEGRATACGQEATIRVQGQKCIQAATQGQPDPLARPPETRGQADPLWYACQLRKRGLPRKVCRISLSPLDGDGSFFAAKLGKRTYFSEDAVCSEALQRKVRWAAGRFTRRLSGDWQLSEDRGRKSNESSLYDVNLFAPLVEDMRIHGCSMQMNVSTMLLGSAEIVLPAVRKDVPILGSGKITAKISWPGPRVDNASLSSFYLLDTELDNDKSGHVELITQVRRELFQPLLHFGR
ncbi:hypothetical protein HPB49_026643 [Dermacentor silvarum]|nr:hypothetical protein HPB49_026643 [Dermacentor silvarum]